MKKASCVLNENLGRGVLNLFLWRTTKCNLQLDLPPRI